MIFPILTSGVEYYTQPFHVRVRVLLLVSTMLFAVMLYLSPAPSTWRWALITVHAVRVSSVFAFLLDRDGVVDGIAGHAGGDIL